jgi:hypothetical protein
MALNKFIKLFNESNSLIAYTIVDSASYNIVCANEKEIKLSNKGLNSSKTSTVSYEINNDYSRQC